MRYAACHPDVRHYARGLCKRCHDRQRRPAKPKIERKAVCHTDRKHFGLGLCEPCYQQQRWSRPENSLKVNHSRREWRAANRERLREAERRREYGMVPGQYAAMLKAQGGRCAICDRCRKLSVDHCHQTGAVRGLLCQPCNMVMGFADANPAFVAGLVAYAAAAVGFRRKGTG